MMTNQVELSEQFHQVLQTSERRVQVINYVLAILLVTVLSWGLYAAWRDSLQEKITSITLVSDSVRVIGSTDLCPGDTLIVHYALAIDGVGVLIADDSVKYQDHTVKFSDSQRDIIDQPETRTYELLWTIPLKPDMTINGQAQWVPGEYVRYISVAASNIYVSRYTPPVRFQVPFKIAEGCGG